MTDDANLAGLRDEIRQLLAAALEHNQQHVDDIRRRDELHVAETDRRDELHVQELHRRDDLHDDPGMTALSCAPDEAFALLKQQSQHENRKLVIVATEVANRAWKRPGSKYAETAPKGGDS